MQGSESTNKEELMPIAWNPDRVMDRCRSEDEKRWLK